VTLPYLLVELQFPYNFFYQIHKNNKEHFPLTTENMAELLGTVAAATQFVGQASV
jgi:hypothetical protein